MFDFHYKYQLNEPKAVVAASIQCFISVIKATFFSFTIKLKYFHLITLTGLLLLKHKLLTLTSQSKTKHKKYPVFNLLSK